MTPEAKARIEIDKKLTEAGWDVQDMRVFNPAARLGVAVHEFQTDSSPADYILFMDKNSIGGVEATNE